MIKTLQIAVLCLGTAISCPHLLTAQATGSLGADPNPCVIPDGDNHCHPRIFWDSSGVAQPQVAITVTAAWGTQTFRCAAANQPGSHQTVGVKIGVIPKIFRLYAVPDCAVDPAAAGTLLAEAEVRAHPPGSVVCPVDNRVLQSTDPGYLGLIGNFTVAGTPNLPFIAAELAGAGVARWRRTVQWFQLEPEAPRTGSHVYDWPRFDNLLGPISAAGIEPWITLSHSASWAVDLPPGADPDDAFTYPPKNLQDWRDFVRAVVERYGPGGILPVPARHWDIWQEPDLTNFFRGTPEDYVELLNAAYDEIKTLDPGATVWAGNTLFYPNRPASETDPWVSAVFADGLFDGYAIHPFWNDATAYYTSIAAFREHMDENLGAAVPLTVSATTYSLVGNGPCAFAALSEAERAAYILEMYACGANAGAEHVFWFKTIDRQMSGGGCTLDGNGVLSPIEEPPGWVANGNLESLRRVAEELDPAP